LPQLQILIDYNIYESTKHKNLHLFDLDGLLGICPLIWHLIL